MLVRRILGSDFHSLIRLNHYVRFYSHEEPIKTGRGRGRKTRTKKIENENLPHLEESNVNSNIEKETFAADLENDSQEIEIKSQSTSNLPPPPFSPLSEKQSASNPYEDPSPPNPSVFSPPPNLSTSHDRLVFERYQVFPQPDKFDEFMGISRGDITAKVFEQSVKKDTLRYSLALAFLPPPPPFRYLPYPKNYFEDLANFEEKYGLKFSTRIFLLQAMIHESYFEFFLPPQLRQKVKYLANMRLGMIGDKVTDLQLAQEIYIKSPKITTGDATILMHRMRANRELSRAALNLDFFSQLVLAKPGTDKQTKAYATAVEALVGGLYIDKGERQAIDFLNKWIFPHLETQIKADAEERQSNRSFLKVDYATANQEN